MSNRMAYLMHVDWNWIKQRPHFMAEELTRCFDVDLFYIKKITSKDLVNNSLSAQFNNIETIIKMPLSARSKLLNNIEKLINSNVVSEIYRREYDVIWITSPIMLQFIDLNKIHFSQVIVYDCMDDVISFPQNKAVINYVYNLEKQLLARADVVFTSSFNLSKKMEERGAEQDIHIINNAMDLKTFSNKMLTTKANDPESFFTIVYFGTIGSWIDFDVVVKIGNYFSDIEFLFYGPKEVEVPLHPRIQYKGVVKHEDLLKISCKANAFIMPFVVDDLILSVDPVKIYEYIALGKPTIVVEYPETLKFSDFVYLYSTSDDLIDIITKIKNCSNPRKSKEEIAQFISNNSWGKRILEVQSILNNHIK
ncbi:hypothetical protein M5X00_00780 [Paenibacillus alvei]|uniref:Putative family 2 glycosyltransferase n=1 Tax=Paenibacillus alvei TaxID=44250 RepID=D6QW64_PAEAL|nr:hypothetical protein [Paenibacillus alvei]ADG29293.1 putative family 2 glycosyltransferase [Paenibacillus alvei]EJW18351.1 putative family 2 glycosyltransferase WsfE [Paenibacillus alvei DSM 29]MCY9542854.1 hypothetical protein [Paenibacillus alvei]MCY9703051.1 hypothetical protein [Paenibacillus alvei]MCY9735726.1 hypothetical protein [Paenibacillus alvei]